MLVALAVRVDEMANLRQQLFDQHGLVQTQAVLGLLRDQRVTERLTTRIWSSADAGVGASTVVDGAMERYSDTGPHGKTWPHLEIYSNWQTQPQPQREKGNDKNPDREIESISLWVTQSLVWGWFGGFFKGNEIILKLYFWKMFCLLHIKTICVV